MFRRHSEIPSRNICSLQTKNKHNRAEYFIQIQVQIY